MSEEISRTEGWWMKPELIWRLLVFVVAVAIVIIITTRWTFWEGRAGWQETDDAYLQSDVTPIAARVSGYIRDIPVQDYQRVKAGQLIAQVDDKDYEAAAAQADASLEGAVAQAEALRSQRILQQANLDAARATVRVAQANLTQNERDVERQRHLLEGGSSSTEAAEKLQTTHAQLTAQLEQVKAQADAAARQVDVLGAQIKQAEATIVAQGAAARIAHINLGYTRIVAPKDGVLGQRQILPGQYVAVGAQVASVTPLPKVWVIANYKETQLTHMSVGNSAELTVDTFPDHVLRGHVLAFAPASGSQFSLLPPDNATGNFTKVVQRIAVKIAIDDADGLADRLRPGMSVVAKIDASDGRK
ncbi:HlyD family secretion protein [Paraburkholderia caledonica]|uniref:Membrane fusion protein (Multidrug efflux system) n=1 Tax=Paraburkholderia caledonica TaxID=134536 RepID=A0ABU1KYX1_9BURK|nr:HlyD family secretion protein [Paraburkholderia caledonica]MDR6376178.1 membrane fusion protein (multidrug efflux system) [Paraburkholderia caledonica]